MLKAPLSILEGMKNLVSVFSLLYWAIKGIIVLVLFQWWIGDARAQVSAAPSAEFAEALATQDHNKLLNLLGNGAFNFKLTRNCSTIRFGGDHKNPSRERVQYRVCEDGTVSFDQPTSTGINGWNGFCGQTAAANTGAMICYRYTHPTLFDDYADDLTPGSRPGTVRAGLAKYFAEGGCPSGRWQNRSPWTANGFFEELRSALWLTRGKSLRRRENGTSVRFTPVPVLISSGLQAMHWVTVVDLVADREDIYGCNLVMNTWGSQRVMTCKDFIDYAMNPAFGYRYLRFEPDVRD